MVPPRRAAARRIRVHRVPLLAIAIFGLSREMSGSTRFTLLATALVSLRTSPPVGGSPRTRSAVSRATPSFRLVAQASPRGSPTMSSRLPPPRSMARAGLGSITTLVRIAPYMRRASSLPLITRTLTPASLSIRSTTARESRASRKAAVAHTTSSSAPWDSARARNFFTTSTAASARSGPISPVAATALPTRSISFSRTISSNVPSRWASATSR